MFLLTACLEVNPKPQPSYYLSSVFREEGLNCTNGNALGVFCTASSGERRCTLKWERYTNYTGKYTHDYAGKVDLTRVVEILKGNCQPITERS